MVIFLIGAIEEGSAPCSDDFCRVCFVCDACRKLYGGKSDLDPARMSGRPRRVEISIRAEAAIALSAGNQRLG